MLAGCSSSSSGSTTDYEEVTKNYIKLSEKGKWDDAEELASLDASNPIKDQMGYIKDASWEVKDLKGRISDERYEELAKKVKEAYTADKIVKSYKIEKVKEDKDSSLAVVKVSINMMSSEKVQDKLEEIINDNIDKAYELENDYLNEDGSDYNAAEKRAMEETFNDDVLNQIVAVYADSYAKHELKVNFDVEKGKIQYCEVDD